MDKWTAREFDGYPCPHCGHYADDGAYQAGQKNTIEDLLMQWDSDITLVGMKDPGELLNEIAVRMLKRIEEEGK